MGEFMLNMAQKTMVVKMQPSAGQALIELAVFGAIFLVVLSVLVRYGIEYNLQQKAEMTAYRKALAIASTSVSDVGFPAAPLGSGGYIFSREVFIPEVAEPMGQGSSSLVGASTSITRNPVGHLSSGTPTYSVRDSQNYLRINSSGAEKDFRRKKSYGSGFRNESGVSQFSIPKYEEFFNILVLGSGGDWRFWDASAEDMEGTYRTTCLNFVMVPNPAYDACVSGSGGSYGASDCDDIPQQIPDCTEHGLTLRIDDPCIAATPDYDVCYEHARVLVDVDFCKLKCAKTNNCAYLSPSVARTNCINKCNNLCILETNPPNQNSTLYETALGGAWYAAGYFYRNYSFIDGVRRVYTFPYLDKFFNTSLLKKIGPGADGTRTTSDFQTQAFDKQETSTGVAIREAAVWNQTSYTNSSYQNNLDAYGAQPEGRTPDQYAAGVTVMLIPSEVSARLNQTWQTDK